MTSSYTSIGANNMIVLHSVTGEEIANYSWQKQERFKGRAEFDPIAGFGATVTAGWGFNIEYYDVPWSPGGMPSYYSVYTVAQANALTFAQLRTQPVFRHLPQTMFSSSITFTAWNELLAKAIPSLSGAAGSRSLNIFPPANNHNYNMNDIHYRNGWPRTDTHKYKKNWLHSDLKDVAYFYNYELFKELVSKGGLE